MKPLELELMGPYELTAHLAHVFCWKFHSSACCNDHKKGTKGDPSSKLWKAIHRETGKLQLQLKTVCFVLINNIKSYICQYEARHIKAGKSSFCWSFCWYCIGRRRIRKLYGRIRKLYGLIRKLWFGNYDSETIRSDSETLIRKLYGLIRKLYGLIRKLWFGNYTVGFGNYTVWFGNYVSETIQSDSETMRSDSETMFRKLYGRIRKLYSLIRKLWFGNYTVWFGNHVSETIRSDSETIRSST